MKAASAQEMRACDLKAINEYGIPGIVLMENAGLAVFRQIEKLLGTLAGKKITVVAGKGNNGGDGYVVARHLVNQGAKVNVFLFGTKEEVAGDASINLNILNKMGVDLTEIEKDVELRYWNRLKLAVNIADCVVDALLGTGFKGEITDKMAEAVDIINTSSALVVAVDIPSGVDADTGAVYGKAVKASSTVTFALPKIGLLLYPGASYAGQLIIADITIPAAVLKNEDIKQNVATALSVKQLLPKRSKDAHKGMNGRTLIVAGSAGLGGAAAMAATGALRAGAGLITLAVPENLAAIMAVKLTEVMTKPLAETYEGTISAASLPSIIELAQNAQVLAVGPGLGRHVDMGGIIKNIISSVACPLVIDADALTALTKQVAMLHDCASLPVLTPHVAEMARLTGIPPAEIEAGRLEVARRFAKDWGCVLVLKGAPTVTAFPDGEAYLNSTGNEGMATGGTGDALTGIIAGFISQGMSSCDAAVAGVYIHGLAGDIAADKGVIGITATDILRAVPSAICQTQKR